MLVNENEQTGKRFGTDEVNLYERYLSTALGPYRTMQEWAVTSERYFRATVAKCLPRQRTAKILDLACGPGRYLQAMKNLGYTDVFGVDVSDEQVQYAQQQLGMANVAQADMFTWLEEHPTRYDCILALDILEHLATGDLMRLGNLLAKALKPGGRVIVQVPSGTSPMNPVVYGDLTHVRAFTPQSMRQLLLHVGLVPVKVREIPPVVHNVRSALRWGLWVVIKPLIRFVAMVVHGSAAGGAVYTSNFLCVAEKPAVADVAR